MDSPILLLGETGTGKSLLARVVHRASARAGGRFLEVSCGAVDDGTFAAELLGNGRHALTNADSTAPPSLPAMARGGTLLLDEVGDLPPALQARLLGFLQEGEGWVGSPRSDGSGVRIVATTNHDLARMVAEDTFRDDLFYRLNVMSLTLPPLHIADKPVPTWLVDVPGGDKWFRPPFSSGDLVRTLNLSGCTFRGVASDRLRAVLRSGIDVEPPDSRIFAGPFDKAWEYGGWPKMLLALDVS